MRTDNQVARSLTTKKELKRKHARCEEQLSEFPKLMYEHCSGASNVVTGNGCALKSTGKPGQSPEGSISTPSPY